MDDNGQILYKVLSGLGGSDPDFQKNEGDTATPLSLLCRICAMPNEYLIPIFEGEGQENNLADRIHSHLPIRVNMMDDYPDHVCYQCASTLLAFHDLVDCCKQANITLMSRVQLGQSKKTFTKEASQSKHTDPTQINKERFQECGRQSGKRKSDVESKRETVMVEGPKAARAGSNSRGHYKPGVLFNHCRLSGSELRDLFNQKFGIMACHLCCKNFTSGQHLSNHVAKCAEVVCLNCKTRLASKALLSKHTEACAIFACQHCPKRFISSETLSAHQRGKHPVALCGYCSASFTSDVDCFNHKSDYHNFNCQKCHKAFLYTIDKMKSKFWKSNGKVLCDLCEVNSPFESSNKSDDQLENSLQRKSKRIKVEASEDGSEYPVKLEMVMQNEEEADPLLQEDAYYAILPEGGVQEGGEEGTMQYQCCYCKGIYDSFNALNNHLIDSHNLQLQELSTDSHTEKENFSDALGKFDSRIDELFETNCSLLEFENQNKYACTVCDKIFKSALTYKKHTYRSHKIHLLFSAEKQFNCQHCKAERSTLAEMNKHLYSKHECTVKCEHCEDLFSSKRERKIHTLNQHPEQPAFSCLDCPMKFNLHNELKQHCSWHWFHEIIDCTDCNKKIKGKKKFKLHMNYHKVRINQGDREIVCPECSKNFSSRSSLQAHLRYVHHGGNEETVLCGDCGLLVKVRRFNRHQERMHSQGNLFRCHICSRAFFAKELLRQHMDTHIDGRPHECDQCSAAFKQVRNLRMHKRNYHSDAVTSCKICNINFESTEDYSVHRHTYHKRTPRPIKLQAEEGFQCPMCPKVLKSSRAVATHRRVAHEKHLHVKCDLCHLEFPFIRQLQSHMSSHTEPKPDLSCGFCHRTFTTLGSLNSHIKWVHVGERNFPCSYCPAKFKRKDAQIVHERTHTDERPYSCTVCQRRFRQRTDCKRHEAKHSMPGFRYNKPHRVRPRAPPEVVIEEVVEEAEAEPGLLLAPGEDSQAAAYLSYIVHN